MRNLLLSTLLVLKYTILVIASSGHSPYTVHTTLRGKKYTLSNVSTVKEVQQSLQEQSGEPSNIILLFGGQKLKSNDVLEEIGVEDGSIMNAIPASTSSKKKKKSSSSSTVSSSMNEASGGESSTSSSSSSSAMPNMEELMKQSGLDPNLMQSLFSQAGGDGDGAPNLEQSMKMMQEMIQTPFFQEFLNDPNKMEESRQLLLQNPMMKSMIESIPFMTDIIGDKDKFRETMVSAAQMYKDMGDGDGSAMAEAMQRMNGLFGSDGMPGLDMNGLMDKNIENLALDELSEGED